MNRSGWNQEMIVLLSRKFVYVSFRTKRGSTILCEAQVAGHCLAINSFFQPKIDRAVIASIEQVVTFILRIVHSKLLANVFCARMDLQREIPSAHRIQEIKTDRKLSAKSVVNVFSK